MQCSTCSPREDQDQVVVVTRQHAGLQGRAHWATQPATLQHHSAAAAGSWHVAGSRTQ